MKQLNFIFVLVLGACASQLSVYLPNHNFQAPELTKKSEHGGNVNIEYVGATALHVFDDIRANPPSKSETRLERLENYSSLKRLGVSGGAYIKPWFALSAFVLPFGDLPSGLKTTFQILGTPGENGFQSTIGVYYGATEATVSGQDFFGELFRLRSGPKNYEGSASLAMLGSTLSLGYRVNAQWIPYLTGYVSYFEVHTTVDHDKGTQNHIPFAYEGKGASWNVGPGLLYQVENVQLGGELVFVEHRYEDNKGRYGSFGSYLKILF